MLRNAFFRLVVPVSVEVVLCDVCLDLPNGDTTNGNRLQLWWCTGGDTQQFMFDGSRLFYVLDVNKCVDGGDMLYTRELVIWDCNGSPQQDMKFGNNQWFSAGNCVEPKAALAGAFLQEWRCDSSREQQQWIYDYDHNVIYAGIEFGQAIWSQMNGLCWDVPGDVLVQSQNIQVWDCIDAGAENQGFVFDGNAIKAAADMRLCVDLSGDDTTDGTLLWLWQCNGSPSQSWGYDENVGTIFLASGSSHDADKCIDVEGSGDSSSHLIIWDCIGNTKQLWSFSSGSVSDSASAAAAIVI